MTINTVNSKHAHHTHGSYSIGSGKDVILIVGSCRVVPYANYFHQLNLGNRWTVHLVNVVNFHFDQRENRVEPEKALLRFEENSPLRDTIGRTKWYLHEHTENFGMLNSDRNCAKNIYQFGMKPEVDIAIPNWNCVFMLFQELLQWDEPLRTRAKENIKAKGELSKELQGELQEKGLSAMGKFMALCAVTSLPEMADRMHYNWRNEPYFWSGSHVSAAFTMAVMRLMNDKFLHLDIPDAIWHRWEKEDQYASTAIPVTRYDVENYKLKWNVPIRPLIV